MLTLGQLRAARAFVGWSQAELADRAGVSLPTIKRMETRGPEGSTLANVQSVLSALVAGGCTFLDDDGERGPGVRAKA